MEKILLIDPVGSLSEVCAGCFEDLQIDIASNEDNVSALQLVKNGRYDLIMISLSGTNNQGLEMIRKIRGLRSKNEQPVIVIAENNETDTIKEALDEGADDFICQPFSAQSLKARLEILLQAKKTTLHEQLTVQSIINSIPLITFIVNEKIRIVSANDSATSFLNKPFSLIYDKLSGEAINCVNAINGQNECGSMNECNNCIIRNTIEQTFNEGQPLIKKEGRFCVINSGKEETLDIMVSTTPLNMNDQPLVLICVDDITPIKNSLRETEATRDLYAAQMEELSNITESLDKVNEKLQEEKNKIEAIFDSSNIGISIMDPGGGYVMVNKWMTEQLGYSEQELRKLKYFELTHPDDIEKSKLWYSRVASGEIDRYCLDKKYMRKDGSFFWADISVSAIYDKNNKVINVIGIVRDITWFKEATDALTKSEIALKEAQNIGKMAHWEYDIPNDKMMLSEQIFKIFEVAPVASDIPFDTMLQVFEPAIRDRFKEKYFESIRTKSEFLFEDQIETSSGKVKYLVGKAKTRYDINGNPVFTLGTIADITERKEIELQVAKQNKELKELNATKDKFLSIISHDLKNAFNIILNLSELLSTRFDTYRTEEVREFIEIISSTSKTTYTLLQNMLEWAKTQLGKVAFNPERINLRGLTDSCVSQVSSHLQIKNITLQNLIPARAFVKADAEMIKTVIRNLLTNSIKFTPNDGMIILNSKADKNMIEVFVSDNGIGMDMETKESLFKTGTVSHEGTSGEKGTGLGLMLCKEFITFHEGEIKVISDPGKGSTFSFTLPVSEY